MVMANYEQPLEAAIRNAIESRTREILEEEISKANQNTTRRLREEIAKIIMSVNAMYSVQFNRNEILIRVENKIG
jgi:hypothetical protein